MKKRYIYFHEDPHVRTIKEFNSLAEMREFATDTTHNGDYYIGVPSSARSYHYTRDNILNKFDDTLNT